MQGADFENTILDIHNQERAAVNVPALSWSSSLASNAQSWANQLLAEGKFEHSSDTSYGENIAQLSRINPNPNVIDLSKRYKRGSMKRIFIMVNQLLLTILCSSVITPRWSGNPQLRLVAGWPVILIRTFWSVSIPHQVTRLDRVRIRKAMFVSHMVSVQLRLYENKDNVFSKQNKQ